MFKLRTLTNYAIIIITVLSATLIKEVVMHEIYERYREPTYTSVAIMMLVTIIVFVPIIHFAGSLIERFSRSYIRSTKTFVSNRRWGLLISFSIALGILFVLFAHLKHNLNVLQDIKALF